MFVRVRRFNGSDLVEVVEGATVADALNSLGVEGSNYRIRLNEETADELTQVNDGDVVTLLPRKVEGGF